MPPTERWPSRLIKPGRLRLAQERLVELGLGERERHVHPRAAVLRHRVAVEARTRRSRAYSSSRLGAVALAHGARARPAPCSHLNTRPAMYQAKVGGVLSIEPSSAIAW